MMSTIEDAKAEAMRWQGEMLSTFASMRSEVEGLATTDLEDIEVKLGDIERHLGYHRDALPCGEGIDELFDNLTLDEHEECTPDHEVALTLDDIRIPDTWAITQQYLIAQAMIGEHLLWLLDQPVTVMLERLAKLADWMAAPENTGYGVLPTPAEQKSWQQPGSEVTSQPIT